MHHSQASDDGLTFPVISDTGFGRFWFIDTNTRQIREKFFIIIWFIVDSCRMKSPVPHLMRWKLSSISFKID